MTKLPEPNPNGKDRRENIDAVVAPGNAGRLRGEVGSFGVRRCAACCFPAILHKLGSFTCPRPADDEFGVGTHTFGALKCRTCDYMNRSESCDTEEPRRCEKPGEPSHYIHGPRMGS